jgi:hypothetical protein
MSPRSENGGGDSGGDSSGNESPALDQDAAGTPDPRGRQTHIQLCAELAPVSNKDSSAWAAPSERAGRATCK